VRVYDLLLLKEAHNFTYDKCVLSSWRLQSLGPETRNCDTEFSYIHFIYLRQVLVTINFGRKTNERRRCHVKPYCFLVNG